MAPDQLTLDAVPHDAADPLVRAVIISLFTWRRANADDVPPEGERMGWWGDSVPTIANDRIGSRLWLLRREKLLPATLQRAEGYARESLQWLIDDGLVLAVAVSASRDGLERVPLRCEFTLPGGRQLAVGWNDAWSLIHV